MANPPNPNGANQFQLDPRQKKCWESYINPNSKTFGNAYQSALSAGYSDASANQITTTEWFIGKCSRLNLLNKAEKVLEEMLDLPVNVVDRYNRDKDDEDFNSDEDEPQELVLRTEPALVKIKQDTAKFVSERLGKEIGYSTRVEQTGANGQPLVITFDKSLKGE
jgi:phage terminase small subunit